MGKRQLHIIKRRLAEHVRALQDSINRSIHALKKGADSTPDPYDLAASESDTSLELAIRERDRLLLLSLRGALVRIERGSYGDCERCGGGDRVRAADGEPRDDGVHRVQGRGGIPGQKGRGPEPRGPEG